MDIADANEQQLLDALMLRWKERERRNITRTEIVETRHVCLYAAQNLQQLRNEVLRPNFKPEHIRLCLAEIMGPLQALDDYLAGRGYAVSSLGDRNTR